MLVMTDRQTDRICRDPLPLGSSWQVYVKSFTHTHTHTHTHIHTHTHSMGYKNVQLIPLSDRNRERNRNSTYLLLLLLFNPRNPPTRAASSLYPRPLFLYILNQWGCPLLDSNKHIYIYIDKMLMIIFEMITSFSAPWTLFI